MSMGIKWRNSPAGQKWHKEWIAQYRKSGKQKEVTHRSYLKNKEKILELGKVRRNSEAGKKWLQEWKKKEKESGREKIRQKNWYWNNIEKAREKNRRYYWRNKEKKLEKGRVWRKTERGKEYIRKYLEEKDYPELRKVFKNAVRNGELKKKPCKICGKKEVEGHHTDYSKPLKVIWVCRLHHAYLHRQARR